jgi:hypothetical protein
MMRNPRSWLIPERPSNCVDSQLDKKIEGRKNYEGNEN